MIYFNSSPKRFKTTTIWFLNEAVCSSAHWLRTYRVEPNFRANCSVWWRAKRLKRSLTFNIWIFLSRSALSSSREEHGRHHQERITPRLYTMSKCLSQIPQVVMNIHSTNRLGPRWPSNQKNLRYTRMFECWNRAANAKKNKQTSKHTFTIFPTKQFLMKLL